MSKLLKVSGILLIIFGSISLVLSIIAVLGVGAIVALGGIDLVWALWLGTIVSLLSAVFELVSGIIGVKNWNKPEKAGKCVAFGVIMLALLVLGNILTLVSYTKNFNVFSLIIGCVLPVLFLIGASQLKKA